MKRSESNHALKEMEEMCRKQGIHLPPFCSVLPDQWKILGHEYDEIRECRLGWDITDYGMGDFDHFGFSLITIRNGNRKLPDRYPKEYAEKLLYLKEGQYAPMHFHWYKTEDIIHEQKKDRLVASGPGGFVRHPVGRRGGGTGRPGDLLV